VLNSNKITLPLVAFATLVLTANSARADIVLYATERDFNKLVTVNTTTNVVTDFHLVKDKPDSLILVPSGKFVYDLADPLVSELRIFDPVANTDTLLAGAAQGINSPQDLALDPNGNIIYTANFLGNSITKTNLTTLVTTTLINNFPRPEGMAFDAAGRFYALAGGFGGVSNLYEINPTTGAILRTSLAFDPTNTLDGLVFDPFSGLLFANSQGGSALYSIDPATLIATKVANVPSPDGLITDTHGLLYIASRDFHVYRFNVLTGIVTQLTFVPGLDDLGAVALTPPTIAKSFGAAQVGINTPTTLTFLINNANASPVTGANFVDALPVGLVVATPNGLVGSCGGGTITAVAGATSVSLTGASIPAAGSCTFTVNVTSAVAGPYNNCVSILTGNAGQGNQSCALLTVVAAPPILTPPSIGKAFGAASVILGGSTTLTFTLNNTNNAALTGVGFIDTLPAGLAISTPNGLVGNTCTPPGTITATAGAAVVSLAGATIAAGGSCTFTVNVTGTALGLQPNSVTVLDAVAGVGNTSTTSLVVVGPPVIAKSFGANILNFNGSTTLSFKITNPNPTVALTGVAVSDTLPAGLLISTPNGLVGTCGGGTITATAGTSIVSLAGATIPAAGSCTFQVDVSAIGTGPQINLTGPVTSTNGGNGPPATATLTILQLLDCGDCFEVRYASNLDQGDSVVNLTNTGTLTDPNALTQSGNICVNVYTFDPSEELVSCCSCLVTPNGLNSLSVRSDLISNTLTSGVPTSVIIKLIASVPLGRGVNNTGGTCNPSSPVVSNLVPSGMKAWGTTLHGLPTTPVTFGLTETPFESSLLSVAELTKLTTFCGFIQANGSGFGICKSCRTGGLGAGAK
jgi:uncharacterized repeat protein (TIGR01451 family)